MDQKSSDYEPLLPGIGFSGYRSFATWQTLLFPEKVTVLAGINNSGKSNVLRFLQHVAPAFGFWGEMPVLLEGADVPRGFNGEVPLEIGMPLRAQQADVHGSLEWYQERLKSVLADEGVSWTRFVVADGKVRPAPSLVDRAMGAWAHWTDREFHDVHAFFADCIEEPRDTMMRLIDTLNDLEDIPKIVTISSARRVEPSDQEDHDWLSGRGIVRALAALQSPRDDDWQTARSRWAAINRFLQNVLDDPDSQLRIPYDFSTVQVETPRRLLPLPSLGSGLEQVIVLAAAATVTTNSLVCLEEPETNLHPLLQKKLVRYLTDETNNQYVIATHSAHLLDDARTMAYHVRLTTEGSEVQLARKPHQLVRICNDLGYRPSDILQANCVIWVEGPSDRIYIRRWLELVDGTLAEGIDYSIMFYGGKLLSHVSVDPSAVNDFINLLQINRASAIVIDSDKTSARTRLSKTKVRIRKEFAQPGHAAGFAWLTKGYTIENYIPGDILKAAVEKVHPTKYAPVGQWENPLPPRGQDVRFDKVSIANVAARSLTTEHLDVHDLRAQITRMVDFIRAANGKSTAAAESDKRQSRP